MSPHYHVKCMPFVCNCNWSYITSTQNGWFWGYVVWQQLTFRQEMSRELLKLDYCNSLLWSSLTSTSNNPFPLQQIKNSRARANVKAPKCDHTTPILRSLHWLKITVHIEYKVLYLWSPPNLRISITSLFSTSLQHSFFICYHSCLSSNILLHKSNWLLLSVLHLVSGIKSLCLFVNLMSRAGSGNTTRPGTFVSSGGI